VFLSHLDTTSVKAKRSAFFQASIVLVVFLAIFLWRAASVYSTYGSPSKLYTAFSLSPCILLLVDLYVLHRTGTAVVIFARGHLWYRLVYGFRPTEIVIRRPHADQLPQFANMTITEGGNKFRDLVFRAVDINLLRNNPGSLTELGFWDIDYRACEEAYGLARMQGPGSIEEAAWRVSVWTRHGAQPPACWMVLEEWKTHDPDVQEQRLGFLKKKLEAIGKGDLYDKWQNLLYKGSVTPSGASKPLNMNLLAEMMTFFEREGVDFASIAKEMHVEFEKEYESSRSELPIGY